VKIEIKGSIINSEDAWIYKYFGINCASPKDVTEQLSKAKKNEEIEVEINSGGGDVFAGSEIYTTLKSYEGNVITKVVGLAASAASVIAMAGDKVLISPTGQLMIHNASGMFGGDYREMEKGSEILKSVNATIANAYEIKTGMEHEELLALMDNETWLTPQKALENKFVDEIMFTNGTKLVASFNNGMLPQEVISKMRNKLKNEEAEKVENNKEIEKIKNELDLEKAKLNLRRSL